MGTDEEDKEGKASEYGIVSPWFNDERPAHQVRLDSYYIDRYEVSNADYARFVQATGHRPPTGWPAMRPPQGRERHPVVFVTWQDAQDYCQWRGKRLPTEAEWERAARGTDGRDYPWGRVFEKGRANVGGIVGDTRPIGSYENGKSPYGAYDMIGNVWEWTADRYEAYPGNTDSSEKFGKNSRVIRGNSWSNVGHYPPEIAEEIIAHNSRTTFRLFADPTANELNDVGFRCALSG
jgi:formylglycine-generating enzyme required for sulfatase activity